MRKEILLVILVRSIFFAFLIYGINQIDTLGTNLELLCAAAGAGTIYASLLAFSRLGQRGFFLSILALVALFLSVSWLVTLVPASSAKEILQPFNLILHGQLLLLVFSIACVSTWGFWRLKDTPTIELIALISGSVAALAGHRDYRLDNPLALSAIAWELGIDQVYLFSALGALIVVFTLLYLSLASLPTRQRLINRWSDFAATRGKRSFVSSASAILLFVSLVYFSFHFIYQHYHRISVSRLNNGVGEGNEEGLSPLGFHSALGSTNQPAALVRLEGDYRENPFTPMLYLRENALSEFNGHEMVIAGSHYDQDIAGNSPFDPFDGKEDAALTSRIPVTHSVYLLAEHKTTMSIDYPLTIRALKNPNPAKFKGSYRAYSMAPSFNRNVLNNAAVGDPRWSAEERQHYLKVHQDPRYRELAERVGGTQTTPIGKALALTSYLSTNSIYTLTPNHEVNKDADQTAPYIFGDLRGYCVHFAHAMVYLLRSLGIPARIGTGYLTDLSQSKDGHILLRMSDRHAWAEIYVTELGWVPFDIQPERVESHADTQVDLKMLEDLMGLLDPGEEILPKDLTKDEPSFEKDWEFSIPLPTRRSLALFCLGALVLMIICKLYLRFGWILARTPAQRMKASYISLASRLTDFGFVRNPGETRAEYRERLRARLGADALSTAELLTINAYAKPERSALSMSEVDLRREIDSQPLRTFPWRQKLIALVNPISLRGLFTRGKWALLLCALSASAQAQTQDPVFDPQDPFVSSFLENFARDSGDDQNKSAEDLVFESRMLMLDQRPLDARTKLLLALQKEPKNFEAHMLLSGYYMSDVGHFRLALKYIKQAQKLFTEAYGEPPYFEQEVQQKHANILYLLSQVRLNLDDYQGALDMLDTFSSYGYYSTWYAGTRAWVLMKLGRLDEAIQVARMGSLLGSEPGRTLNMLGILLSMKGEPEMALDVLRKATAYELSLGRDGQPATPLNNSGEVYKEMFAEDQAENAWVKATSMPDGCEHVLPSLNLALLYIDQLNIPAASKAMDSFESCSAQFPLRNGEEHRSLVHLIRGRVALHQGSVDKAIEHFKASLSGRQWFGKIGTDQEDLDAGARVSLAQALMAKNNRLALTPTETFSEYAAATYQHAENALEEWWVRRRAQQILSEELDALEDLSIRNTDSLLEYPTLGDILAPMPLPIVKRRVTLQEAEDLRRGASPYYLSYLAAAEVALGRTKQAREDISNALNQLRPQKDELLKLYLYILQLKMIPENSEQYAPLAIKIFAISRPALRNYGFRLPIVGNALSPEARVVLYNSGFIIGASQESPYTVSHRQEGDEQILELIADGGVLGNVTVRGGSLVVVGKKLADLVSTIEQ